VFNWSVWLPNVASTLGLRVCANDAERAAGGCRWAGEPWPWSQAAGIVWHEASHTHGYIHGADDQAHAKNNCGYSAYTDAQWNFQTNTMPYIIEKCISTVIEQSGTQCGSLETCGSHALRLIDNYNGASCSCQEDPRSPGLGYINAAGGLSETKRIAD